VNHDLSVYESKKQPPALHTEEQAAVFYCIQINIIVRSLAMWCLLERKMKLKIERFLFQAILGKQLRSTAVGTYSALLVVNTYNSIGRFYQFIIMGLCRKLFLSILGYIEGEFPVCGYGKRR